VRNYWLFKTEPVTFGWDRLERDRRTEWSGVRSYQARNNMLEMKLDDLGFFYHSSTKEPGIVGIVRVVREAYPDFTAFQRGGPYYDPKSTPAHPIWQMVDVEVERAELVVERVCARASHWAHSAVSARENHSSRRPPSSHCAQTAFSRPSA